MFKTKKGFHGFRWGLFHLPGPTIFPKGLYVHEGLSPKQLGGLYFRLARAIHRVRRTLMSKIAMLLGVDSLSRFGCLGLEWKWKVALECCAWQHFLWVAQVWQLPSAKASGHGPSLTFFRHPKKEKLRPSRTLQGWSMCTCLESGSIWIQIWVCLSFRGPQQKNALPFGFPLPRCRDWYLEWFWILWGIPKCQCLKPPGVS